MPRNLLIWHCAWIAVFAVVAATPVGTLAQSSRGDAREDIVPISAPIDWQLQDTGVSVSLRGLCVVDETIVWASGADGVVLKTTDGGDQWQQVGVATDPELDFRDIHAWDANNALVVAAGTPARFYRTDDGGQTWKLVFEHPATAAFFDAVSFFDDRHGIAMSDPLDGRLLLVETRDAGHTWQVLEDRRRPRIEPGEAGFAGSGTNMRVLGNSVWIALGGAPENRQPDFSRIAVSDDRGQTWAFLTAPTARSSSAGIFSICPLAHDHLVVVGGDFREPDQRRETAALSFDSGKTWREPVGDSRPSGYRSCVSAGRIDEEAWVLVCVGPNGTDRSDDGGRSWVRASDVGFHAVQFSPSGRFAWASGSDGRIARWRVR